MYIRSFFRLSFSRFAARVLHQMLTSVRGGQLLLHGTNENRSTSKQNRALLKNPGKKFPSVKSRKSVKVMTALAVQAQMMMTHLAHLARLVHLALPQIRQALQDLQGNKKLKVTNAKLLAWFSIRSRVNLRLVILNK